MTRGLFLCLGRGWFHQLHFLLLYSTSRWINSLSFPIKKKENENEMNSLCMSFGMRDFAAYFYVWSILENFISCEWIRKLKEGHSNLKMSGCVNFIFWYPVWCNFSIWYMTNNHTHIIHSFHLFIETDIHVIANAHIKTIIALSWYTLGCWAFSIIIGWNAFSVYKSKIAYS